MDRARRVLILDDSPVVLMAAQTALEKAGMSVLVAEDLAGLERQLAEGPDLIVIDVNLPEAFGDDVSLVLKEVRALAVPILLFSSLDEPELAARAQAAGVTGYVCKSAGVGALVARARSLLST